MGLKGRYFSQRDMNLINSINAELMGDIIEDIIMVFKISPKDTATNVYGETAAATGKWYMPAIEISCLVDRPDSETNYDDFGPSRNQDQIFKMREKMLRQLNFYPQEGDMVFWNDRYFEIDNVVQNQLLGGQPDKSHSIICNSHYTKITSLNVIQRND